MENIDSVCATAGKEYSLLKAMEKMEEEWVEMNFDSVPYKDTGTSILRKLDEVEQLLDDQIVRTQAMRGSRFIGPLKPRVEKWEKKLNMLSEIMEEWLNMQGTWLYLEPIFSSEDICKQMPAEAKRFKAVDTVWRLCSCKFFVFPLFVLFFVYLCVFQYCYCFPLVCCLFSIIRIVFHFICIVYLYFYNCLCICIVVPVFL